MKRFVCLALCMVMLFALSAQSLMVSAAEGDAMTFTLTADDVNVGETLKVSVSISADSYFTNATIFMHYNPAVVEYVTDYIGEASPKSAMYMSNNFIDEGYVKAAYVTTRGITAEGEFLVFEFKLLTEQEATFDMSFIECVGVDDNNREFDINYTVVPCTINAVNTPDDTGSTTTTVNDVTTTTVNDVTTTTVDNVTTTTVDAVTTTTVAAVTTTVAVPTTTTGAKATDDNITSGKATDDNITPSKATDDNIAPPVDTADTSSAVLAMIVALVAMSAAAFAIVFSKKTAE